MTLEIETTILRLGKSAQLGTLVVSWLKVVYSEAFRFPFTPIGEFEGDVKIYALRRVKP
jgi:hypothetical protein